MAEISQPELLRTALFAVWKHRRLALVTALTVWLAALAALLLRPTTYESEARVFIGEPRENPARLAEEKRDPVFRTMEEVINSEVTILTSAYLRGKVIERLGPGVFAPARVAPTSILGQIRAGIHDGWDAFGQGIRWLFEWAGVLDPFDAKANALRTIERGLGVAPVRKANVIEVTMRSRNPQAAVLVLETVVQLYLERHSEIHRGAGGYEFFQVQAERARTRLAEVETRLQEFRSAQGLAAIDEQKRLQLGQLTEAANSLERTTRELVELEARIQRMRADMGRMGESVTLSEVRQRNPVLDTIESRLVELQLQREKLGTRYQGDSRVITDLDREIERLRDLQTGSRRDNLSSVTAGQNATYKELERLVLVDEARADSLRASRDTQRKALAASRERLDHLLSKERELNELTREVAMNQSDYETYRRNLESRRINAQMDQDRIVRVTVIDPPTSPAKPAGPSKLLALAIALVAGLILGGVVAIATNAADRSISRPEDLEALAGMPVLAALTSGRAGWWRDGLPEAVPPNREPPPARLLAGYRRLARLLAGDPRNIGAAALIGTERGVGTTSTLVALGSVLSGEFGADTVLVDADFDTPSLEQQAATSPVAGLADVVEGRATIDAVIRHSGRQRMWILPAGRPGVGALQLVEDPAFAQCLAQLKARYRFVLLRSPPLSAGAAAQRLAGAVDGAVLLVRAAQTPREAVADAITQLQPARDRLLGAVLTHTPPLPRLLLGEKGFAA